MSYYVVLGVDPKASAEDIKRAYHRCARESHPDKCHNDPDANERMKLVNEAFTTLSDPHKRLLYDAGVGNGAEGFDWNTVMSIIEKLYKSIPQAKKASATAKGQEPHKDKVSRCVDVDMVIDLAELCKPQPPVKKIAVKVVRLHEGGKRVVERKTLYVSLMNYQDSYTFHGEGDELSPGIFGDICIKLVVKPHECYHLDSILSPYDLHYERPINLYEYFYGVEDTVSHIDGVSSFRIDYMAGKRVQQFTGLGVAYLDEETNELRRGDLYVMFDLRMPEGANLDAATLKREDVRAVIATLSMSV